MWWGVFGIYVVYCLGGLKVNFFEVRDLIWFVRENWKDFFFEVGYFWVDWFEKLGRDGGVIWLVVVEDFWN